MHADTNAHNTRIVLSALSGTSGKTWSKTSPRAGESPASLGAGIAGAISVRSFAGAADAGGPSQALPLQNLSLLAAARAVADSQRGPWVLLRSAPEPMRRLRTVEFLLMAQEFWQYNDGRDNEDPRDQWNRVIGRNSVSLPARLAFAVAASLWRPCR